MGRRWLAAANRRPFGRLESAFYEWVASPAVRTLVAPVLLEELRAAGGGRVLDVGCGSGAITVDLAGEGRSAVGVDPSLVQVRRAHRRPGARWAAASAAGLPFAAGAFDAVVSSCAIKHWPDLAAGLADCARGLRPGGHLVIVEIDGGDPAGAELRRFAARTRIPPGLRRLYPGFARRSFVPFSPPAPVVVAAVAAAGFTDVEHRRLDGLPFVVVTASKAR